MTTLIAIAHLAHLINEPQATITKVNFGKYQAVLRIPEGGLFAQEESDVEFRVVDTTHEDNTSDALAKAGTVRFTACFPKPGLYKAHAQFNSHGSVKTLPFTISVKK